MQGAESSEPSSQPDQLGPDALILDLARNLRRLTFDEANDDAFIKGQGISTLVFLLGTSSRSATHAVAAVGNLAERLETAATAILALDGVAKVGALLAPTVDLETRENAVEALDSLSECGPAAACAHASRILCTASFKDYALTGRVLLCITRSEDQQRGACRRAQQPGNSKGAY
eukprot:1233313-Prymnesium_polylepis.3